MTNESSTSLDAVAKLYQESLAAHGPSACAVGWRNDETHELRFAKLASVIKPCDASLTVNDLGCGYGGFYEYLTGNGFKVAHFRGYDIVAQMLEEARRRVPQGEFFLGSAIASPAQYSFACGIFNVRLQASEEDWRAHVERTLDNLREFSTRGFAFNLLSTYVDYREPHLFYGDPLHFFDLCKRRYSRRVALLHDYPLFEWTMTVDL